MPGIQGSPEFMNPNYKEELETGSPEKLSQLDSKIESSKIIEEPKPKEDPIQASFLATEAAPPIPPQSIPLKESTNSLEEDLTPQAQNFKALRKLKEKAEQEAYELRQQLEYQRSLQSRSQTSNLQESDDNDELDNFKDDDLLEGKHLKKVAKQMKQVRSELEQYRIQTKLMETEAKLKRKYSDFDEIVSQENLQILAQREPDIAAGLNANPDLYSKAVTAYTMIKDLGISIPQNQKSKINQIARESKLIDENLSRPQVAAAVAPQSGDSPLSKAHEFAADSISDNEAKMVYAEMLKRSRG